MNMNKDLVGIGIGLLGLVMWPRFELSTSRIQV
jgi:hypothetical protein